MIWKILQGFLHPRWSFGISSINSISKHADWIVVLSHRSYALKSWTVIQIHCNRWFFSTPIKCLWLSTILTSSRSLLNSGFLSPNSSKLLLKFKGRIVKKLFDKNKWQRGSWTFLELVRKKLSEKISRCVYKSWRLHPWSPKESKEIHRSIMKCSWKLERVKSSYQPTSLDILLMERIWRSPPGMYKPL